MKELRTIRFVAAALVLPLAWGCGDDDPTTPVVVEFDPEPTTAFIQETLTPLNENQNLIQGLIGLEFAVASATDESAAAPGSSPRLLDGHRSVSDLRPLARARWNPLVTFPAALMGETLVYAEEEHRYRVDEAASGAPEGGVRVTYYTMTQSAVPAIPLQVRGHIDLTDESVNGEDRLGIRAVSTAAGESTLADYYVGIAGGGTETEGELDFSALGSITGGGSTLDFDLLHAFQWDQAQNRDALQIVYVLDPEGQGSIEFSLSSEVAFNSLYDPLDIRITVDQGASTTVLEFTMNGSTVSGEIHVDGVTVVHISGQDPNPVFEWADGREMTSQERAGLLTLWEESVQLLLQPGQLLAPVDLMYSLG